MVDIYSKIDSDRFGIKVGKLDETFFGNSPLVYDAITYFQDEKYDLIIARIDLTNLDLINGLERRGFILKDIQTILSLPTKNFDISNFPKKNESYMIREMIPSDINSIVDITTASFNPEFGGHYFNDIRLNPKDCTDAYSDWVYNSCINKDIADKIFVSESPYGEVAGYISVKTFYRDGKKYSDGVLGAVNPKHRGNGVFKNLAIHLIEWSKMNKVDGVENNVLIDNYPVNRVYMNLGYRPTKSTVTLHGWMDEIQ